MLQGCKSKEVPPTSYLFFLHGYWLEEHKVDEVHPDRGIYQYHDQLAYFQAAGLEVISEQRPAGTNAIAYAEAMVEQVDSLLSLGIAPEQITIAGASKGGYIAQYVATLLQRPALKFVFIASFQEQDLETIPQLDWCGSVLSIYEASDPFGVPARERHLQSSCQGTTFLEVRLTTGLEHGFIFRAMPEWQDPVINFAKRQN